AAATSSYDARASNLTPGVPMSTMKIGANFLSLSGSPACAMNVWWVSAEAVATTLAPLTTRPLSVSSTTCTHTSATSSAGLLRSIGGWTSAWFMKSTRSWARGYQRRGVFWVGGGEGALAAG